MKLTITSHAQKQIRKFPKAFQIIVANKIRKLTVSPIAGEGKLKGYKNFFRVKIGVYRIVYAKFKKEIEVVLVGHRRDIYRILERLLK